MTLAAQDLGDNMQKQCFESVIEEKKPGVRFELINIAVVSFPLHVTVNITVANTQTLQLLIMPQY